MPVTRQQAMDTLKALNVAEIFLQSYSNNRLPKDLDLFFSPPEEFFLAPDTQQLYTEGRLIPLLDDGSFALVLFYDPEGKCFVRKYLEHPHQQTCYANWQQYLADLIITIAESIDNDCQLEEIAALLEFRYLPETLVFLDALSSPADLSYESKKAAFI